MKSFLFMVNRSCRSKMRETILSAFARDYRGKPAHGRLANRTPQPPPVEQLASPLLLADAPERDDANSDSLRFTRLLLHVGQVIFFFWPEGETIFSNSVPHSAQRYSYNAIRYALHQNLLCWMRAGGERLHVHTPDFHEVRF
jgi:hypothetical protein